MCGLSTHLLSTYLYMSPPSMYSMAIARYLSDRKQSRNLATCGCTRMEVANHFSPHIFPHTSHHLQAFHNSARTGCARVPLWNNAQCMPANQKPYEGSAAALLHCLADITAVFCASLLSKIALSWSRVSVQLQGILWHASCSVVFTN